MSECALEKTTQVQSMSDSFCNERWSGMPYKYPNRRKVTQLQSVSEDIYTEGQYGMPCTRTHTGVQPFKCKLCYKAFAQKITLEYHTRTHTAEKTYKCNICQKSFA